MPAAKRKEKSGVAIIGTGRLGTTLAVALAAKDYSIQSLVARRAQNARKAARLLDAEVQVLAAKDLRSLICADLFLITVPVDQIASVARGLSEINGDRGLTALHTSGA
jgi:predicted dinucleotide-binding enzyme